MGEGAEFPGPLVAKRYLQHNTDNGLDVAGGYRPDARPSYTNKASDETITTNLANALDTSRKARGITVDSVSVHPISPVANLCCNPSLKIGVVHSLGIGRCDGAPE